MLQTKSEDYTSGPGTALPRTSRSHLVEDDSHEDSIFQAGSAAPGRIRRLEGGTAVSTTPIRGESADPAQIMVPVMSPDELRNRLLEFEQKYEMSSESFYRRWKAGQASDVHDAMRWAMLYELWRDRYLL